MVNHSRFLVGISILLTVGLLSSITLAKEPIRLKSNFTFSGVFIPSNVDTNGDGFGAAVVSETLQGVLKGTAPGAGPLQGLRLVRRTTMMEYELVNPAASCFRINEESFSVEEDVYIGPLFVLIDPIRMEPVASNPALVPYRSENWTSYLEFESGELLFIKLRDLQICVENVPEEEAPWPICHVKSVQEVIGGTGRFKGVTGQLVLTAIAPTATSNGPAFDQDGNLNLIFPPSGVFLFGPSYGAAEITLELPGGFK